MAKKRKKYLVTADNSEAFACSLVTSPAVEETFVSFNEDTPLIEKFADEKKHMVTGVVAIPNKPLYRRNADGEEYDIVFSAEAIEKMSKDFMKNYHQHDVTLQHQENAEGIYLVEQWIKTDMVYDKSLSVGLSKDLPVGSWIQTYYVDSNDVWRRIQDGELLGFSLECMLGLEEIEEEFNKINDNTMEMEENFWIKLKNVLSEFFNKEVEEQTNVELEEEKPSVKTNGNEDVEPTVAEDKPIEQPTVVDDKPIEDPSKDVIEQPKEDPSKDVISEVKEGEASNETTIKDEKDTALEELINNLKSEIEALKEVNTGLQDKIKEMGKTPSAKPISTNAKPNGSDKGVEGTAFKNFLESIKDLY